MVLIKQSTAIEWDFFAMDANGDGVTAVADGSWTKRIKKSAGAFAAMTVTVSELENGWYKCTFSSAHTDTLGCLSISFSATGVKRVNLQFLVRVRATDDLAFPAVSGRSTAIDAGGAVLLQAVQTGVTIPTVTTLTNLPSIPAGWITAAGITDGAFTAVKFAAGAYDAVWSVAARLLTAGTNIVLAKGTGVTGFNDLSAAQVNTEADTALADAGVTTAVTGRIDADVSSRLSTAGYTTPPTAIAIRTEVDTNSTKLDVAVSTRATPAQVNTEVLDVLNVDTFAEPAAGAPPATTTLVQKLGWLYAEGNNEWVGDGSTQILKKNDGSGDLAKQTTGASGGTTTMGKLIAP